uniref:Uncharacterized protein n=1 Tax=Molossus molossus TaxID=27622 RepID=A0A7J8C984_MOLMO|nr:hypothetical protein HJG59_010001 [Molossus molossus]
MSPGSRECAQREGVAEDCGHSPEGGQPCGVRGRVRHNSGGKSTSCPERLSGRSLSVVLTLRTAPRGCQQATAAPETHGGAPARQLLTALLPQVLGKRLHRALDEHRESTRLRGPGEVCGRLQALGATAPAQQESSGTHPPVRTASAYVHAPDSTYPDALMNTQEHLK